MKDHPKTIEKRHFSCRSCGYNSQVYGEMYFDFGCYNYIATFSCNHCHILFEGLISKIEEWDTKDDFIYDLEDETICLICGKSHIAIWNKESGRCPKCSNEMIYKVEGAIKVHHKIL